MDHKERLKALIKEAFADAPRPRHDRLIDNDRDDESQMVRRAFLHKNDWRTIDPAFLDRAPEGLASALSFLSDATFRFYLPAYLLADIDGQLGQVSPYYHLTLDLDQQSPGSRRTKRLSVFTTKECLAIIRYLDFKLYTTRGESKSIKQSLSAYWYPRAYLDTPATKYRRKIPVRLNPTPQKQPTEREIRKSYPGYNADTQIFPESVLIADPTKQNYSVVPRTYYVDILKSCHDCQHEFIFYATEQKHWYEVLGFYIHADCVRCPNCRTTDQTLRRRFQRYSKSVSRKDLTDDEFTTLLGDALFLYESGLLKTDQQLRRLRNQARKRHPNAKIPQKLDAVLANKKP